ncbi:MAG: hypothetical protein Q9N26_08165, partial [Aquificota bacterium]|nr:hypothetical protein [Aquificota bacterium]
MKKSYLAAAAILGVAVLGGEAHAVKIDLGETVFKMGFRGKVQAGFYGERSTLDTADLMFSVPNGRIYAKGSITKIFKWTFQGDFKGSNQFEVVDNFITLDFAKEFRIVAG